MRIVRFAAAALGGLLLLAACDSPSGGGGRVPARLDVVSGNLQPQAVAGTELPEALVVRVVDDRGRPVSDQLVNFVVTAGGGSVFAGSATTDRQGEARERWTLGTAAGDTQRVEARAVNAQTGAPIVFATFRAVARAAAPAALEIVGAQHRDAPAGAQADSLVVRVKDAYGNGVPGATVTWLVAAGGGSISPAQSTTRADGTAKAAWTLGPSVDAESAQQARAHLGAAQPGTACVPPACAQFAGRGLVPAGAVAVKVSGDNQAAVAGSAFPVPFVVRVTTAAGQPLRGVAVRWQNATADSLTDAAGEARAVLTAGGAPGSRALPVTVQGVALLEFTVTVVDPSLSVVAAVNGTALDFREGRLLWVDANGDLRATVEGATLSGPAGVGVPAFARLYLAGPATAAAAVYVAGGQLYDWDGGAAAAALGPADPATVRMDGAWLAWRTGPGTVVLRNLAAGTQETLSVSGAFDVGPNGDLVYSAGGDLARRRGGTVSTLVTAVGPLDIATDGVNVLYSRLDVANRTAVFRYSAAGGVSGVASVPNASAALLRFTAAGGWSAVSSVQQVATVSPGDAVRRVSVPSGSSFPQVRDVSMAGAVIFDGFDAASGAGAKFLLPAASDTPVRIGPTGGRAYFEGTIAYVISGGTVYRAN